MPESEVHAQLRQPTTTPSPVSKQWVKNDRHEETIDGKSAQLPPLRHGAGRNGRCGVHEHHLKQEDGKNSYIVDISAQEPSVRGKQPKRFAEQLQNDLLRRVEP